MMIWSISCAYVTDCRFTLSVICHRFTLCNVPNHHSRMLRFLCVQCCQSCLSYHLVGATMVEWLCSWLAEQEVRGSITGLATWISEIGYLLLPSRDMAEIPIKRRKSSIHPTNQSYHLVVVITSFHYDKRIILYLRQFRKTFSVLFISKEFV